jgi:hypothetical protein
VFVLQRIKWALFVSVPIWFGYGFARDPDNLEWVKRVVSVHHCCCIYLKKVLFTQLVTVHPADDVHAA